MTSVAASPVSAFRLGPRTKLVAGAAIAIVVYFLILTATVSGGAATAAQQVANALTLGAIYALVALGYTMVYGIIELINFAHFNVFMSGTFFGLWFLALLGFNRASAPLTGVSLALVFVAAFAFTMLTTGALGAIIERICLKPMRGVSGTAPMITTIGVSLILQSLILFASNFANNVPFPQLVPNQRWSLFGSTVDITLKNVLLWT